MSDRWDFYFCHIEDRPASIFLDLGIVDSVPVEGFHVLVRLRLIMRSPRPDGLSSREEYEVLKEIEDRLQEAAGVPPGRSMYVGRCTSGGFRDFYFYAGDRHAAESVLSGCLAGYPGYEFEMSSREDPTWDCYRSFLSPSERERQTIENERVLRVLEREGDDHSIVRPVSHWCYFRDPSSRKDLCDRQRRGHRSRGPL